MKERYNTASKIEKELNQESIIYSEEIKIDTLNVEDHILLNSVVFKTLSGNISLPKEVKELNKLEKEYKANVKSEYISIN